jgi:hypothetical protein
MELEPLRFLSEPVDVGFRRLVLQAKRLGCPDTFVWL